MAGVLSYALTLDVSQMQAALQASGVAITLNGVALQGLGATATQSSATAARGMQAIATSTRSASGGAAAMINRLSAAGLVATNIVSGAKAVGTAWQATSRFFANGGVAGALARVRGALGTIAADPAMRRLAIAAAAAAAATLGIVASVRLVRAGFGTLTGAARTTFNGISNGARGAASAVGKITGASMLGPLAAIAAPLGLATVAFKAFTKAADFESLEVGFTTVLGSATAAKDMLEKIRDTAASTPFGITELAQSAKSLLAVTAREDITPTLRMIGDLASAAQRPITDLASMYAKIKGSDNVQGEDLNQLSDALPGSLQEFVKVLKVDSVAAVRKLGEEGKITGAALDQVFINLTSKGGIAFGAMQAQSKTTNGLISTLKDAFDSLLVTLGKPITDFLKPFIESNTARLETLTAKAAAFFAILKGASENGNLGEVLGASLNLAFITGINTLSGGIRGIAAYLASSLPVVFKTAVDQLTSPRIRAFFENIFNGIGAILISKLQSAASAFSAVIGRTESANKLAATSKFNAAAGGDYFQEASKALSAANLGETFTEMGEALRQANEAGQKAAAAATSEPFVDPAPAFARLIAAASKADADALNQFLNPAVKKAAAETSALTSTFKGLKNAVDATKPKAPKPEKPAAAENAPAGNDAPAEPPAKRRGILNVAASAAARLARRQQRGSGGFTLGNTDRLALADLRKRQLKQGLTPDAAAAQLARGSAAADPGKDRRAERKALKAAGGDPLLMAVRDIQKRFETLATA
jgi:Tape measure protein